MLHCSPHLDNLWQAMGQEAVVDRPPPSDYQQSIRRLTSARRSLASETVMPDPKLFLKTFP